MLLNVDANISFIKKVNKTLIWKKNLKKTPKQVTIPRWPEWMVNFLLVGNQDNILYPLNLYVCTYILFEDFTFTRGPHKMEFWKNVNIITILKTNSLVL